MRSVVALAIGALSVGLAAGGGRPTPAVGTDDAAVQQVHALRPGYQPWFRPLRSPSPVVVDRGLGGQSVAGLLVFIVAVSRLRRQRTVQRGHAPAAGD